MSKWVVVLTDRHVHIPKHGCGARIIQEIKGLQALGFKVCLIANKSTGGDLIKDLADDVVVADEDQWDNSLSFDKFDSRCYWSYVNSAVLRHNPVAVIASFIWMAPALQIVPQGILKIIDTHDLMHKRKEVYDGMNIHPWCACTRAEETRFLEMADVILAIQKSEAEEFKKMVPDKEVIYLPHYPGTIEKTEAHELTRVVMLVSSDNPTNKLSLDMFLEKSWDHVVSKYPKARLKVYGKVKRLVDQPVNPWNSTVTPNKKNVEFLGFVENLDEAYKEAEIVINPSLCGTGMKIKTIEALSRGKAVVTTSWGCSGIEEGNGKAFWMDDEPNQFGIKVAHLLYHPIQRARLEKGAFEFAQKNFSLDIVFGQLNEVLLRSFR